MAIRVYVLEGGGPNSTLNSFLTTNKEKVFRQIGADMIELHFVTVSK